MASRAKMCESVLFQSDQGEDAKPDHDSRARIQAIGPTGPSGGHCGLSERSNVTDKKVEFYARCRLPGSSQSCVAGLYFPVT